MPGQEADRDGPSCPGGGAVYASAAGSPTHPTRTGPRFVPDLERSGPSGLTRAECLQFLSLVMPRRALIIVRPPGRFSGARPGSWPGSRPRLRRLGVRTVFDSDTYEAERRPSQPQPFGSRLCAGAMPGNGRAEDAEPELLDWSTPVEARRDACLPAAPPRVHHVVHSAVVWKPPSRPVLQAADLGAQDAHLQRRVCSGARRRRCPAVDQSPALERGRHPAWAGNNFTSSEGKRNGGHS